MVGGGVLRLAASFLAPVPLGNVAPAPATDVIAVATLDEDRALLGSALAAALVVLVVASLPAWEAVSATGWVPGILWRLEPFCSPRCDAKHGGRTYGNR